uniref:Uncharacterized protein n=1 Tax=Anguilla anguilla TaxID=7936 RepID=A0A0E9WZ94_ANGAN
MKMCFHGYSRILWTNTVPINFILRFLCFVICKTFVFPVQHDKFTNRIQIGWS